MGTFNDSCFRKEEVKVQPVVNYLTENKQYDSDLGYKDKLLWWAILKHINI